MSCPSSEPFPYCCNRTDGRRCGRCPEAAWHVRLRRRAPGDTVAASAFVRDFAAQFPAARLSLDGQASRELFAFDLRVRPDAVEGARALELDTKPTVDAARHDRSRRYVYALHDDFESKTGLRLRRGPARPELVLGWEEQTQPLPQPYYVVASGTKPDMPVKAWPDAHFAEVLAVTRGWGWHWVQAGAFADARFGHRQSALPGAESALGRTDLRELVRLVAHAAGVLCLCSLPMLLASAFGVPCVALGGGREDPWLHADLGVAYLDSVGTLDCCRDGGCYRCGAVRAHAGEYPPNWLCVDPAEVGGQAVGRCLAELTPAKVLAALSAWPGARPAVKSLPVI